MVMTTKQMRKLAAAVAVASVTALTFAVNIQVAPPAAPSDTAAISVHLGAPPAHAFIKKLWGKVKDTFQKIWKKFIKPIGQKILDFIKKPMEKAKEKMKAIIDKAKKGLTKLLENKVLMTAIAFVLPKVIPGFDKIVKFVQQVMGKIERLTALASKYAGVVDAWVQGNKEKFKLAVGEASSTMDIVQKIDAVGVVTIVIELIKDKLLPFVRSKTIDLLEKVFSFIEVPINAARTAIASALGSIPFVGWALSGAVDVIINLGLKFLRSKGFEFVADQAAKLVGKLVDKVGGWLKKQAAKLDANPKFVKFFDKVKGFIAKAAKMFEKVKGAFSKVKGVLNILASKPSFGDVMAAGLGELARGLYNKALDWLGKNKQKAADKIGELVSKVRFLSGLKDILLGGFNEGGDAFLSGARACGSTHIQGSDIKKIASGLLGCLKDTALSAVKTAGVGALRGAWDAFVNFLGQSCDKAVTKLGEFAGKVTKIPLLNKASGLVNSAIDALRAGCTGAVEKVAAANPVK
jgi:hypothetical protein